MRQFTYKAVNRDGGQTTGIISAADKNSAVMGLAERGEFVIDLAEERKAKATVEEKQRAIDWRELFRIGSRWISGKDILAMTSQLNTALRAGLPLLNGLEIIRDQQHKPGMRELLDDLAESVRSGESLSEALSKHSGVFSPLYISMVRVGETGGILDDTTCQLTDLLQRDEKIKTSIKNASAYPIFVLCLGLISVVIVVTWILPNILAAISGGIAVLPWPTRMLLAMSGFFRKFGFFVAIGVVGGWFYFRKWARAEGRASWDAFKLKIPVVGSVLRTIAVGRFARTLGALTSGGVSILESLKVVRDTLGNELLARQIDNVAEKVKTGSSLAVPLEESGFFPPLLVQIVSIGEQTGKLDELLLSAAETFDEAADAAIERFTAIFPAVLILLLAIVIFFIVVATLLPIIIMELSAGSF